MCCRTLPTTRAARGARLQGMGRAAAELAVAAEAVLVEQEELEEEEECVQEQACASRRRAPPQHHKQPQRQWLLQRQFSALAEQPMAAWAFGTQVTTWMRRRAHLAASPSIAGESAGCGVDSATIVWGTGNQAGASH